MNKKIWQGVTGGQLAVVLATVGTIILNLLANIIPYGGQQTAVISDKYLTYFTPAGYVFAIWGVIYIGLIAYALYHLQLQMGKYDWWKPAVPWFVLAAITNVSWLFAWHYEQLGLSVIIMVGFLVTLIKVYLHLEIGKYPVSAKTKWMVHMPISIYLGWVSVALIGNIAAALVQSGWDGFGVSPVLWSVIMISIAVALSQTVLWLRNDYAFACVAVWAILGIGERFHVAVPLVLGASIVAVVSILTAMGLRWWHSRQ